MKFSRLKLLSIFVIVHLTPSCTPKDNEHFILQAHLEYHVIGANIPYDILSLSVTHEDSDSVHIRIDWGDGTNSEIRAYTGNEYKLPHTWSNAGLYNIRIEAKDINHGQLEHITLPLSVISVWQKAYGGPNNEAAYSFIQTADGGFIIAGYTDSYGNGVYDFCIMKLTASGNLLWIKAFGGSNYELARSITPTSDGGFAVVGSTSSFGNGSQDVYVLRFDANGDTLWSKTFGGSDKEWGNCIISTPDGGFLIAGTTCSFGHNGTSDAYIIKIDASGDTLWTKTFGSTNFEGFYCVTPTQEGGFVAAGYCYQNGQTDIYALKLNENGDSLWSNTFDGDNNEYGRTVVQVSDGGIVIAGEKNYIDQDISDIFILKLDANGNSLWAKTFDGGMNEFASSIVQSADGSLLLAGGTNSTGSGGYDAYVLKLDSKGDSLWSKTFGGNSDDAAYSIIKTTDGGFAIAGSTKSFGSVEGDCYIVKFDPQGNAPSLEK
jgi:uncharacterized delta-60 repeat protein